MRIGVIAHLKYPIAEPFAGGLEMHTHLLCRQLRLNGHDVTLFAATLSDPALGLEAICDQTEIAKVGDCGGGRRRLLPRASRLSVVDEPSSSQFVRCHTQQQLALSTGLDGGDLADADGHHAPHAAILLAGKRYPRSERAVRAVRRRLRGDARTMEPSAADR